MRFKLIIAWALFGLAGLSRLQAQGGPPMITDDPGTPGNGHWEINLAWTDARTPGVSSFGLPLLDANYGVGDRIEVTYEAPWAIVRDGDSERSGFGNSLIGAKWRFADSGEHSWQASVYPQLTFLTPGSHSDRRGLADADTTLLLPFEVEKDLGPVALNFDVGHIFGPATASSGWMGGMLVGRNVTKAWEVDAEVHLNASESLGRTEWIVNAGSRLDLSEHLTVLLALGRDLSNQTGPRISLLSYVGLQLRL
jgi:hypothetical protein